MTGRNRWPGPEAMPQALPPQGGTCLVTKRRPGRKIMRVSCFLYHFHQRSRRVCLVGAPILGQSHRRVPPLPTPPAIDGCLRLSKGLVPGKTCLRRSSTCGISSSLAPSSLPSCHVAVHACHATNVQANHACLQTTTQVKPTTTAGSQKLQTQ